MFTINIKNKEEVKEFKDSLDFNNKYINTNRLMIIYEYQPDFFEYKNFLLEMFKNNKIKIYCMALDHKHKDRQTKNCSTNTNSLILRSFILIQLEKRVYLRDSNKFNLIKNNRKNLAYVFSCSKILFDSTFSKPLREPITDEQYELLMIEAYSLHMRNSKYEFHRARLRLIYTLLFFTGLRLNEVALLSGQDILKFIEDRKIEIKMTKVNRSLMKNLPKAGQIQLKNLCRNQMGNTIKFCFIKRKNMIANRATLFK